MALPGDVIGFGIARKGCKNTATQDYWILTVTLEGLRDLANKTQRDSPQPMARTSSNWYFQQTPEDTLSKTSVDWNFSKET